MTTSEKLGFILIVIAPHTTSNSTSCSGWATCDGWRGSSDPSEMIQEGLQARLREAIEDGKAHGGRLRITVATDSVPNAIVNRPLTRVRSPGLYRPTVDSPPPPRHPFDRAIIEQLFETFDRLRREVSIF